MAQIIWNAVGERIFEAGVDQGVLYIKDQPGVPWNGLVSVTESPSGGDVSSYYIDGINYLDHAGLEEFNATIEAYMYPDAFSECEGIKRVQLGLFTTNQPKKSFGLAYRVKVGNDLEGTDHGYKIHLVYNATADSSERPNSTIAESLEPANFSWAITTRPPTFVGYRPTSHFVIDSREVPSALLEQVENMLYGTVNSDPRLPSVPELLFIFSEYEATEFDAGTLVEEHFTTFDAGVIPEPYTSTIDSGGP